MKQDFICCKNGQRVYCMLMMRNTSPLCTHRCTTKTEETRSALGSQSMGRPVSRDLWELSITLLIGTWTWAANAPKQAYTSQTLFVLVFIPTSWSQTESTGVWMLTSTLIKHFIKFLYHPTCLRTGRISSHFGLFPGVKHHCWFLGFPFHHRSSILNSLLTSAAWKHFSSTL